MQRPACECSNDLLALYHQQHSGRPARALRGQPCSVVLWRWAIGLQFRWPPPGRWHCTGSMQYSTCLLESRHIGRPPLPHTHPVTRPALLFPAPAPRLRSQACPGFVSHENVYYEAVQRLATLKQSSADTCCSTCSGMEGCSVWSYCSGKGG